MTEQSEEILRLRADLGRAVERLPDAITWAIEWTAKQTTIRDTWPLSWDAGFPGLKAQGLLDYAALSHHPTPAKEEYW